MARRPSFPRICIALGSAEADTLLARARQEADNGGSFLEFRLDYLRRPSEGPRVIRAFCKEYPECQVLATCRRQPSGGRFRGTVDEQLRLLEAAAEAGARAVDLEIESAQPAAGKLDRLRAGADLIVSYHNFHHTPAMEAVLRRLKRIAAAAYKIAVTARKPTDIHRVLALAKAHPRDPLVLLAMGEAGFPTRVVAPVFGGLFTYAAPSGGEGTAPGQVSAWRLRHLYRVEKLSRATRIYGVIADPVGHSISPAVHNRAFQSRRIDAVYLPFLVTPPQLKDFFGMAEKLPVTGFSVTIPHKQKVLRYLDIVDRLARRIGAANTVWRKGGKWRGVNTDVNGVTAPLARRLRLAKASVLIAGNGGAARAAAFALAEKGARITIVGRNPERARKLARACGAEAVSREELADRYFEAVIHATPLGMYPDTDGCLFEDRIPGEIVFDMVYNPLETVLLRRAREQNKTVIDGLEMFIEQAVSQFEIWTGTAAPRAAMETAAREALAGQPEPIIKK
ncbi:MAG: shikimate dehydrogenase [Armatimonadetes bacterium]|nr:shikimate dehydrogenase [Armatimonadota bacterium]